MEKVIKLDKIYIIPVIMSTAVIFGSTLLLLNNLETRGTPRYIEEVLVSKARTDASSCSRALSMSNKPTGFEWDTESSEEICGNICLGRWLEEESGTVREGSRQYLEGRGYDDYLVEAACLAGKPQWITEERN